MTGRGRSATQVRHLERILEGELRELVRRLRRIAARPRPSRRKAPRPPLGAPASPVPASPAPVSPVLALPAPKGYRLVHGTVWHPGTPAPVRHSWIEADDRVHDSTLGEGRRVWPRELYYLVFRAAPTRAA